MIRFALESTDYMNSAMSVHLEEGVNALQQQRSRYLSVIKVNILVRAKREGENVTETYHGY